MSVGEASNSFFWLGYYKEIIRAEQYSNTGMSDVWNTYCMGGEL